MFYDVHIAANDDLPGGPGVVIVERNGLPPLMVIAGETARAWSFVREWERLCEVELPQPTVLRAVV